MRPRLTTAVSFLMIWLVPAAVVAGQATSIRQKQERIAHIKRATVRILIDGKPNGSGFVISKDGLIATAFHAVFKEYAAADDTQIMASPIEVEFYDGTKLPATLHKSCLVKGTSDRGTDDAFYGDYCILQVTSSKPLDFLKLGTFAGAFEGADVYICGYPLLMNKALVHFGVLSTKSTISYSITGNVIIPKLDGTKTQIAWLDITLNKGNSGGPVVIVGKEPNDDVVIGIVSISINPIPPDLIELIKTFNQQRSQQLEPLLPSTPFPPSSIDSLLYPNRNSKRMTDEDIRKLANLVGAGLTTASLGFGACVSIDNLKRKLEEK